MPDPSEPLHLPAPPEGPNSPLHGLTLLLVEDSRFACDALRLICQRAGARMRRAETLSAARAHLRLYRPDVVVVDLGLPDGRGEGLIRDLCLGAAGRPRPAILGFSGDPAGRGAALAAGADGFVEKPVVGVAGFVAAIRRSLGAPPVQMPLAEAPDPADPLALHDDLARAAEMLRVRPGARVYVAGFVEGVARSAADMPLARVASAARRPGADGQRLAALLATRLAKPVAPLIAPRAGAPAYPAAQSE